MPAPAIPQKYAKINKGLNPVKRKTAITIAEKSHRCKGKFSNRLPPLIKVSTYVDLIWFSTSRKTKKYFEKFSNPGFAWIAFGIKIIAAKQIQKPKKWDMDSNSNSCIWVWFNCENLWKS